jgi:hypothetical protein
LHGLKARSSIAVMVKRILIGACLTLCVAACAASPPTSTTGKPVTAATAKVPPAGCVADTATRIAVKPSDCAGFGRTWTDQDVKSTGATDAAQALRQLDPTVVVTH